MQRYSHDLLGYAVALFACYGVFVSDGLTWVGWCPVFPLLGLAIALMKRCRTWGAASGLLRSKPTTIATPRRTVASPTKRPITPSFGAASSGAAFFVPQRVPHVVPQARAHV
ncbi:MAG TPA: hypothetical protein VLA19_12055, partial [Herpetosiphonaceae bacterium]|nr:hypothetical protein [Herpetosiphonaceae bacterium]